MTHLDSSSARTEMRNYILENYLFTDDQAALTDSDWFLEAGILDSTGIMEIIFFLEEQFSIKVEEEEMVPENLDSIDNLVDYIVKKTA